MRAALMEKVIPRLAVAFSSVGSPLVARCPDARLPPTDAEIAELASVACGGDLSLALRLLEARVREGLSIESVLLHYIARAARLLGDQWLSDERSFADVTAGMGALQHLVGVVRPTDAPAAEGRGEVLLLAATGEQHTLGLHILAEFLKAEGWAPVLEPAMNEVELASFLRSRDVLAVGITASHRSKLASVQSLCGVVRRCRPTLPLMLGGIDALLELGVAYDARYFDDATKAVRWLEKCASSQLRRQRSPSGLPD
jgi:methanogenic corrinoid protein MtbC1